MNTRTQELIAEAQQITQEKLQNTIYTQFHRDNVFGATLADLVAKECIDVVIVAADKPVETLQPNLASTIIYDIKDHFGFMY